MIEDRGISPDYYDATFGLPLEESSRFLSIELISYEYSEIYRIMEDIWDEDY